jgi:hypothetical protein
VSLLNPDLLLLAAALVCLMLSYAAIVWRPGWRWTLGVGTLGGLVAWLLMLLSFEMNRQSFLGGLGADLLARTILISVVFGGILQAIDALRPNGGSFAFRAWGLLVLIIALTAYLVAVA